LSGKCSTCQSTAILRVPTPRNPPKSITAACTTPPRSTMTSTTRPRSSPLELRTGLPSKVCATLPSTITAGVSFAEGAGLAAPETSAGLPAAGGVAAAGGDAGVVAAGGCAGGPAAGGAAGVAGAGGVDGDAGAVAGGGAGCWASTAFTGIASDMIRQKRRKRSGVVRDNRLLPSRTINVARRHALHVQTHSSAR
jgi:hypothetical protein